VSQWRRLVGSITVETPSFHDSVVALFETNFPRLFRYLDRLSGEPELAADLAQEAFVKLYGRGSLPDQPEAWLVTVALNLFRNVKSTRARRRRLLTITRAESVHSDPAPLPAQSAEADELRRRVRRAIAHLSERDQRLLLLRAEGYSYRDIATALELNEASIGTLLARAKRAFTDVYQDESDAPR
jgi:RNA polymerase sigma-70 factor (ECF subfamily)